MAKYKFLGSISHIQKWNIDFPFWQIWKWEIRLAKRQSKRHFFLMSQEEGPATQPYYSPEPSDSESTDSNDGESLLEELQVRAFFSRLFFAPNR